MATPLSKPQSSRPYILWEGILRTDTVQRIFDRYVASLQRELLFFSQTLHFIGLQSGDAAGAAALVRDSTAAVDALLTTALADLRDPGAAADPCVQAVDAVFLAYHRERAYRLELTSPRARRFLDLVLAADQLVQRVDALWMAGELSDRAHVLALMHVRRVLARVAVGIVQQGARTHALSWFYRHRSALPFARLAEDFRDGRLEWGEAGYLYSSASGEEARVALCRPLALAAGEDEAAWVREWADRGWLMSRGPQTLLGLDVIVLGAEASQAFLTAAGVTRPARRRLAAEHQDLLLAQAQRAAEQATRPEAVKTAVADAGAALAESQRDWLAEAVGTPALAAPETAPRLATAAAQN